MHEKSRLIMFYIYIVSDKLTIDVGFANEKQDVKKEKVEDRYQESLTYEVNKIRPMMK